VSFYRPYLDFEEYVDAPKGVNYLDFEEDVDAPKGVDRHVRVKEDEGDGVVAVRRRE
jgi:hypothetical protein